MESFFLLFARTLGFFFFSPLFRWQVIPPFLRFGLALSTALLLAPSLSSFPTSFLPLTLLAEGITGYLMGFLFSLLFEGAAFAGEVVGTMMGLSVSELFQPVLSPSSPLLSKLFTLLAATLLFSLDFHHLMIRTLIDSFPATFHFAELKTIILATSALFKQALLWGAPLFILLTIILFLIAIASRIFPELPVLWMGFPLQLFAGFIALLLAVSGFPEVLHQTFHFIDQILKGLI
jgi:flagellar biosynthesis protein FliR